MQACGRLVARMGEQDVDRDIAAGIEIDGGDMALVMGDLDDPAIDDRYVAARQIGLDIGRNVMTIGEDSQLVSPIVEQPDRLVRRRAGPDEAPMLAGDFKAVAIGTGHDGRAPAFGKARNIRHLVSDAVAQDQAARPKAFAIGSEYGEIVDGAGDAVGPGIDEPDRGIARQLLPRLGQDVQRWLVIVAEQTMRMAGEAVARQAGIENGDLAAGTAELQGAGEAGKAAADDDDVIHGDGLRVVDGGGWAGPGAQYRPAIRARDGQRAGLRHRRESRPADLERHFHCVVDRRVPPSPNGMEASKGARAISVKPAAVRMRATRPRSPNENGPGASGSGGAVSGTMPLIASIGRRTQSFSAMPRQQTKATRAPGLSARRI